MEDIKDVSVEPLVGKSNFLKPLRLNFTQNGKKRIWDLVKAHDSVACVLFNTSRNVLIFVKQFRPVVYFVDALKSSPGNCIESIDWSKVPAKSGVTTELCAGIVDTDRPLNQIMKSEVIEECGYDVPLENFHQIISSRDVGNQGSQNTVFYAECTDAMKVNEGGGLADEGELIDVIEMTIPQAREYMSQSSVLSPASFLFGMMWFFANKAQK